MGYKGAGVGTETFRGLGNLARDDWLLSAGGGEKAWGDQVAMGLSCYGDSNVCKDCGVTGFF